LWFLEILSVSKRDLGSDSYSSRSRDCVAMHKSLGCHADYYESDERRNGCD
jgi:hypothetical protein